MTGMTFEQFRDGLRALTEVDWPDFREALAPGSATPGGLYAAWETFRDNSPRFLANTDDATARALFKLIEERTGR